MGQYLGDQAQVGFFYESGTYASTSGVLHSIGLVTEHSPTENVNVVETRYLGDTNRNVARYDKGALDYEGTITYFPQDWKMLTFAIGSVADTWAGSPVGPKTHTFVQVNSNDTVPATSGTLTNFISFGLEDSKTTAGAGNNFVKTIKGATINTFTINVSQGELVNCEMNYIAQSSEFTSGARTTLTGSTPTQNTSTIPFKWDNIKFHAPSGTTFPEATALTLEINNNMEAPHYLNGSRQIAPPIPLNRDYTLTLSLPSKNSNAGSLWNNYFQAGSEFNAILDVTKTTGSEDLILTFSGCIITEMDNPTVRDGIQEVSATIKPQSITGAAKDYFLRYNMV